MKSYMDWIDMVNKNNNLRGYAFGIFIAECLRSDESKGDFLWNYQLRHLRFNPNTKPAKPLMLPWGFGSNLPAVGYVSTALRNDGV